MSETFNRILCPVDFSETAAKALRYAERLAGASEAEVVVLHAFDIPETYDRPGQTRPADPNLAERLKAIVPASRQVKFRHSLHAGLAGEVICWFAQDQECDLIVMGTHGRSGLKHLFLGSVAEHVMRHAPCPVLVVRDKSAKDKPLKEPIVYVPVHFG
jgi:nucleotide-binding universal stress UspA family protein